MWHSSFMLCSYLFWSVKGNSEGLYRIDLADLDGHSPVDPPTPFLPSDVFQAFVVDPLEYRLYFPNPSNASMMAVYLSGPNDHLIQIHPNTQKSAFQNVTSLAYHQGIFYWSTLQRANREVVFAEEYNSRHQKYYHAQLLFMKSHYTGLHVWHPLSQPKPGKVFSSWKTSAVGSECSYEFDVNQNLVIYMYLLI